MLGARTFLLVTGANRGIGRQIALDFSAALGGGSTVLLLARSEVDLETVAAELRQLEATADAAADRGGAKRVLCYAVDLRRYDAVAHRAWLQQHVPEPTLFERCLLVHNAGSVDATRLCLEYDSVTEVGDYLAVNFASAVSLTSVVMRHFAQVARKLVVNVSSKAAEAPLKSTCLYSAAKAARNMFFRVLAAEYPDIRVLNYCPGPVDTAMFHQVRTDTVAADVKEYFEKGSGDKHEVWRSTSATASNVTVFFVANSCSRRLKFRVNF